MYRSVFLPCCCMYFIHPFSFRRQIRVPYLKGGLTHSDRTSPLPVSTTFSYQQFSLLYSQFISQLHSVSFPVKSFMQNSQPLSLPSRRPHDTFQGLSVILYTGIQKKSGKKIYRSARAIMCQSMDIVCKHYNCKILTCSCKHKNYIFKKKQ